MKKFKWTKLKIVIIVLAAAAAIAGWTIWFCWSHPTYYKFNDRFIIGNTEENIVKRYGEPDALATTIYGCNIMRYKVKDIYESNIFDEIFYGFIYEAGAYYVIEFDENGVANDVYLEEHSN